MKKFNHFHLKHPLTLSFTFLFISPSFIQKFYFNISFHKFVFPYSGSYHVSFQNTKIKNSVFKTEVFDIASTYRVFNTGHITGNCYKGSEKTMHTTTSWFTKVWGFLGMSCPPARVILDKVLCITTNLCEKNPH